MTSYLLDTNHISAILKNNGVLLQKMTVAGSTSRFGICVPSVAEHWYMMFFSAKIQQNDSELKALLVRFPRFAFDEPAAQQFGRTKAELRRIGRPIPDFDVQIAAVALVNDLIVLTGDAHFKNISNLKSENWLL